LTAAHELLASPYSTGVYIADGGRVRSVDPAGVIRTCAGDGYMHAVGDGLPATSAILNQPLAVALDSAGNLFIADTGTQRIRQVGAKGTISTAAGTGAAAFGGDGSTASAAALNSPMGVAMDASGNLLIADTYNHRIRQVTADLRIRTVAGTGTSGYGADGAAPLTVALRGPRGVCSDRAGAMYIVDTSNHRVLRAPFGGAVQTVAGNGSPGDAGDGGDARFAQLNQPTACHLDSNGNL
jgi:sugar lactone lactonase YvrE